MIKQLIAITVLTFSVLSVAKEYDSPAKTVDDIKQRITELVEYHGIPGLSVAIVENDHNRLVAGFGMADREQKKPASAETLFRIGSISKMFVSLAALKLQEQGKLDLNTPLKELAPDIEFDNPWSETDPVRLVHLLEHSAGWDDIHLTEYASNDPAPLTLKQALDYHPDSRVSRWRPGVRMSYANSGPAVAAYVIEKVTGMDFETYINQQFFQPLEMTTATYRYPEQDHLLAKLYQSGEEAPYWHISMRPSGSINASARDMANLVRFYLNRGVANGDRILSVESIRRMETPETSLAAKAGMKTGFGTGNFTTTYKNFVFYGHNGGVNGGVSHLAYLPNQGVGYAIAMNSDNSQAFKAIYQEVQRYITFGLSGPKLPEVTSLPENTAEQYSGFYRLVNPRQALFGFGSELFGSRYLSVEKNIAAWGEVSKATNKDIDEKSDSKSADKDKHFYPISDQLLRRHNASVASMALLKDESGLAVQIGTQYWQKISSFNHYATKIAAWTFITITGLHILWFFVWGIRRLNKKISTGPAMQIRIWPALAAFSILGTSILLIVGELVDVFVMLGQPSFISVSILILTWLYPVAAIVGLIQSVRYRSESINSVAKVFCLISSAVFVLSILYLLPAGLIGLSTFSY